ncbi:hypothetical protein F5B22DRAFT_661874 [Xylaria bambusicola]|uniref:uncharacterized protein n=1 Tax=Xylaria bambusicola TaxID=326684 RepID=UPI0020076C97|nr:uncharacterized protein F5B22DRAFT_661874 [Xylaria bambusicola]KAI0521502.1 hypothetical protein F5B22DRAFT_661874 [Xylaria bambusicola]
MSPNLIQFLKACCCFPQQRPKPNPSLSSPIRRAEHYNSRLRANLGWEVPERSAPGQSNRPEHITMTTGQSSPHPRIRTEGRFPIKVSPEVQVEWLKTSMDRERLKELCNVVHATFEHVPYAICGLGALINHGITGRKTSRISILCPQTSKNAVKSWAATRGFKIYGDSICVPTKEGIRRVRIKYIEFGFEQLQTVKSSFSNATVLSLTSTLDNIAAGHLENLRRGDERALTTLAADIFWILKLMAQRHENIDSRLLPTFLGEEFFTDFTARHSNARTEMALAGIDVSAALAKHRTAASLREHDELLRNHGLKGDVADTQIGQFENMKSLGNKSVYTLHGREAGGESNAPPMEQSHARRSNSGGRNLTSKPPRKPKSIERPVADWI